MPMPKVVVENELAALQAKAEELAATEHGWK